MVAAQIDADQGAYPPSTFDRPQPVLAPAPNASSGQTPLRATAPILQPDPLEVVRSQYEMGAPTTTKGKILQALANAGLGFLRGAANNPDDPIAAGIGGAATGGVISAVNPRAGRMMQFEQIQRPGIEDRLRREEAQRQRQRQIEADELKRQETLADIDLKRSTAQKNRTPAPLRARAPMSVAPGSTLVDTETGRPIYQAPPREKTPTYRETYTGKLFDIGDPAQRAEYERIQSSGPRDKQGRFISRADERASAPKQPKAEKKYVSISKVRQYAQAKGISESDAAAQARQDGYTIVH
jgi:hypothetical protein